MRVEAHRPTRPDNNSLESDRRFFLIIAHKLVPLMMIDLLIGPAQRYQDLVRHYALSHCNGKMTWEQFLAFLPYWKTVESEASSATPGSPLLAFRQALLDWSVRWHLDADWCRDHAIAAMRLWGWSKGAQRYFCWDSFHLWSHVQERLKIIDQLSKDEQELLRGLVNDPAAFGINVSPVRSKRRDESFNPFTSVLRPKSKFLPINLFPMEPLARYLRSARNWLEQHPSLSKLPEARRRKYINMLLQGPARRYYYQVARHFRRLGWKQKRQQPEHLKHLTWAVLYQVCGVECSQIAAGPPLSTPATVSPAISRVLKQLGLRNRKRQRQSPQTTS